ncbi:MULTISPECIES: isopenicillin N synthase family dioxygenase [Flavobacteriaceae]|uniref:Isopenicillin N synthase family oxygenase n=2 Tax=Flavobacteriaceae TaxID=49546 RepID=A0A4Y8AUY4_9FLAO|nr:MULTISPECIES: 2-oxoglutarate and iron-dependent oxygenase domain-containing protein [Flavobacteriaceae]TEW76327.1 isopenicillin N synthase family oxygenase [Gramella jeungdoensis]GGK51985.1 flavonol synthase [Lutibacter litoralis]
MNNIPSVDLSDFLAEDPSRKQKFIKEIGEAYEEIGFVALKSHFLTDELTTNLYAEVKRFFELPTEIKESYEIEGIGGQRGYTSFGKESAKGKKQGDLKEFWHFGQEVIGNDTLKTQYPKNVLVKEVPNFNKVGMEAYKNLEKTAIYVLRALALYIGLDEFYFDKYVTNGNSILRPIHYPPIQGEPKGAVRAAAHGDINLITLLMGASAAGLEVQNKQGKWIPVTALPEQLVINVGDMLERLTNNKLRSTIHRVVNPPREEWGKSRYSIPFFTHPISEMSLNCLPECITETHPKVYDDITAGAFLNERLRELGLIK